MVACVHACVGVWIFFWAGGVGVDVFVWFNLICVYMEVGRPVYPATSNHISYFLLYKEKMLFVKNHSSKLIFVGINFIVESWSIPWYYRLNQ